MEALHLRGRDRPSRELEQVKTMLTVVERQLEFGGSRDGAYKPARLRAAFDSLDEIIRGHETEMKFPSRREGKRDARD